MNNCVLTVYLFVVGMLAIGHALDTEVVETVKEVSNNEEEPLLQCYECFGHEDCEDPRLVTCSESRAELTRRQIHFHLLLNYEPLEERKTDFFKCITLDWQFRGLPAEVVKGCYYWLPQYNNTLRLSTYAFCHRCYSNGCNDQPMMRSHLWRSLKQYINNMFTSGDVSRKLFSRGRMVRKQNTKQFDNDTLKIVGDELPALKPPQGRRGLQECF